MVAQHSATIPRVNCGWDATENSSLTASPGNPLWKTLLPHRFSSVAFDFTVRLCRLSCGALCGLKSASREGNFQTIFIFDALSSVPFKLFPYCGPGESRGLIMLKRDFYHLTQDLERAVLKLKVSSDASSGENFFWKSESC